MMPWIAGLAVGLLCGFALHATYQRQKARRVAERRVVEAPNSTYASALVRGRERQDRWSQIVLSALHPLNRGEVEHLIRIVTTQGETALSERERTFLDTLSEGSRK